MRAQAEDLLSGATPRTLAAPARLGMSASWIRAAKSTILFMTLTWNLEKKGFKCYSTAQKNRIRRLKSNGDVCFSQALCGDDLNSRTDFAGLN